MKSANCPLNPSTLVVPEFTNGWLDWQPYADIHTERMRAYSIHFTKGNTVEQLDPLSPEWLPIVIEEIGEAAHVLNDDSFDFGGHYESNTRKIELRKELVQVAAMVAAWIDAIDYDMHWNGYRP